MANLPIHVVHVLGTAERDGHAIAKIVQGLSRSLDARRFRISACFLSKEGPLAGMLRETGTDVSCVPWRGALADVAGAARYAAELRRRKPGIVHLHVGGTAPRLVARGSTSARTIAHFHSLGLSVSSVHPKRSTRFADLVIANSAATRATIRSQHVIVVHPSAAASPARHREAFSGGDVVILGIAARLVSLKGIDRLIEAVRILSQEHRVVLEVAGSGPEHERLERDARRAQVQNIVKFLGWRSDVTELMQRWDIYVQPSVTEGFGYAVLEAMTAGLPVVAADAGGLPELVVNGESGLLVPPNDASALARALQQLIEHPDQAAAMGAAARERATRKFSPELEAAAITAAYESVLG